MRVSLCFILLLAVTSTAFETAKSRQKRNTGSSAAEANKARHTGKKVKKETVDATLRTPMFTGQKRNTGSSAAEANKARHTGKKVKKETVDATTRGSPRSKAARRESSDEHNDGMFMYRLEHSLKAGEWTNRGSIDVQFSPLSRLGTVKFSEGQTIPNTEAFKELVKNDGLYKIRFVPVHTQTGANLQPEGHPIVTASVKACSLAGSGFRELIVFHCDIYGNLLGLDYKTPTTGCKTVRWPSASVGITLQSKAKIDLGKLGEKPKNIREPAQVDPSLRTPEQKKKLAEEAKTQKTFWEKYWVYIVPLGIYMLLQAAAGDPEGEGGGKGGKAQ